MNHIDVSYATWARFVLAKLLTRLGRNLARLGHRIAVFAEHRVLPRHLRTLLLAAQAEVRRP